MTDQPSRPANMTGTPSPGAQGGPAQGPQTHTAGTTAPASTTATRPAGSPPGGANTPAKPSAQASSASTTGASASDVQSQRKKVEDLRKQLQEEEAKLNAMGSVRETTAEEDMKADQERAKMLSQQAGIPEGQIVVSGRAGGPFMIQGADFGMVPGTVVVGDRNVEVTRWNNRSIKGMMPQDIRPGNVTVKVGDKTYTTKWPPQQPQQSGDVVVHLNADQLRAAASPQQRSGVVPPLHPDSNKPSEEAPPGSSTTPVGQRLGEGSRSAT